MSKVLPTVSASVTQGNYAKFTPKQKAGIGNHAALHGTSASLCHFKKEFFKLKWSIANDWTNAVIKQKIDATQGQEQVDASQ